MAGVQAQATVPPFVGLWTRLERFDSEELGRLIDTGEVVRATTMRHTIHFVTARDYRWLRPTIQPALDANYGAQTGKRLAGFDIEPLLRAARKEFAKRPLTFAEVKQLIRGLDPECDVDAVAYAVRTKLPLISLPKAGRWRFGGRAPFALAGELDPPDPHQIVRRYLAAFGPATPGDATVWSGVGGMRAVFEELRGELRPFRDERGRELFDLADAPRPPQDTPAPVRFLPVFDNTLLSHKDRTRVVAEEFRKRIYLDPGRLLGSLMLDGFVAAGWRVQRTGDRVAMEVEQFRALTKAERAAAEPEAHALMEWTDPDATDTAVVYT